MLIDLCVDTEVQTDRVDQSSDSKFDFETSVKGFFFF